jgi:hypothetical protein
LIFGRKRRRDVAFNEWLKSYSRTCLNLTHPVVIAWATDASDLAVWAKLLPRLFSYLALGFRASFRRVRDILWKMLNGPTRPNVFFRKACAIAEQTDRHEAFYRSMLGQPSKLLPSLRGRITQTKHCPPKLGGRRERPRRASPIGRSIKRCRERRGSVQTTNAKVSFPRRGMLLTSL